jgi:hypothetical protein
MGRAYSMHGIDVHTVLAASERRRQLGKLRRRWEDNINMILIRNRILQKASDLEGFFGTWELYYFHLVTEIKNSRCYTSTPHTSRWRNAYVIMQTDNLFALQKSSRAWNVNEDQQFTYRAAPVQRKYLRNLTECPPPSLPALPRATEAGGGSEPPSPPARTQILLLYVPINSP